jgi:hypothetical protein
MAHVLDSELLKNRRILLIPSQSFVARIAIVWAYLAVGKEVTTVTERKHSASPWLPAVKISASGHIHRPGNVRQIDRLHGVNLSFQILGLRRNNLCFVLLIKIPECFGNPLPCRMSGSCRCGRFPVPAARMVGAPVKKNGAVRSRSSWIACLSIARLSTRVCEASRTGRSKRTQWSPPKPRALYGDRGVPSMRSGLPDTLYW